MRKFLVVCLILVAAQGALACSGAEEKMQDKTVYREKTVVVEKTTAAESSMDRNRDDSKAKKASSKENRDDDYDTLTDDSGSVIVEIPAGWDDRLTDEETDFGEDGMVVPSVTASTDLDTWHDTGGIPGVFFLASGSLAQSYTDDQLLDPPNNDFSAKCELGERKDFERGPYSGRIQAWDNCYGKGEGALYTVAAASEDRECVVVLQVGTYSEKDREAAKRILDTFEVDCERVTGYEAAKQPAPEAVTEVPEATTSVDPCYDGVLTQSDAECPVLAGAPNDYEKANARSCEEIYGVGTAPCQGPCPEGQIPMGEGCGTPPPTDTPTPQAGGTCPPGEYLIGGQCLSQAEYDASTKGTVAEGVDVSEGAQFGCEEGGGTFDAQTGECIPPGEVR